MEWKARGGYGGQGENGVFRVATPNSRGQYSAAVLDELESQNDEHVGVLTSKVKMLKDVSLSCSSYPIPLHFPPILFCQPSPYPNLSTFFRYALPAFAECERTRLTSHTAHPPHRRRNPRLDHPRRENERPVRKLETQDKRHDESYVEDGAEDGRGVEGLGGVLCDCYFAVLVGVVGLMMRVVGGVVMG